MGGMETRQDAIKHALLRVGDAEVTRGTAFLVSEEGLALTCHHVVAGLDRVRVWTHDERELEATLEAVEELAPLDLALLRCEGAAEVGLPIETDFAGVRRFRSQGFHYQGRGLLGPIPVEGTVDPGEPRPIKYWAGTLQYELAEALVLKGDEFDVGISGAPLVDHETGVVVGVINTRLANTGAIRGCAIPLGPASRRSPTLTRLLTHNRDAIPRFGRYINALGARELCARQARTAVQELQDQGQYLPEVFCERPWAQHVIEEFLAGEPQFFPLLGNSGVGKTTLLVHLADAGNVDPVVLLLADDLEPEMRALPALLRHALEEVSGGVPVDLRALLRALDAAGSPLTVLLDALDRASARLTVQSLRHWLDKTQHWLKGSRTHVIVGCRPEWWTYLRPPLDMKRLYAGTGGCEEEDFRLGDFSGEEVELARWAYGISVTDSPALHHPMMLRMVWETQQGTSDQGGHPVSRMAIFERFLDVKCLDISARLNGIPSRSHLRQLLAQLAEATLIERTYGLSRKRFYELLPSPVGEEFVRENLLYETAADLRFTFDEVAEYLQSEFIKLPEALHAVLRGDSPTGFSHLSDGPLVFALLRLEQDSRTEALRESLEALCSLERREQGHNRGRAFWRVFSELTHPSPYFALAREFVEYLAKSWGLSWSLSKQSEATPRPGWFRESRLLLRMLQEARFTLEERLTLLHRILPSVKDYPWREHDRDRQRRYLATSDDPVAILLMDAITESPHRAFGVLVTWLGDSRMLEGAEATVADVARACLINSATGNMEELCKLLVKNPEVEEHHAWTVLDELSRRAPRHLASICYRWALSSDPMLESWAGHFGLLILDTRNDPARRKARGILTYLVTNAQEPHARMEATKGLLRFKDTCAQVLMTLEDAFLRGDPRVDAHALAPALRTHFFRVLKVLTQCISEQVPELRSETRHTARVEHALDVLLSYNGPLKHQRMIVHRLRRALDVAPGIALPLAFRVHLQLYYANPKVATHSGLLRFAEDLIRKQSADVRDYFITFAYGRSAWSGFSRELVKPLRAVLEEVEDDPSNLEHMLSETHDNAPERHALFTLLETIGRRFERRRFEALVISAASIDEGFAENLLPWLERQRVFQPRDAVRTFLEEVRNGMSPADAAQKAYQTAQGSRP